MRNAQATAFDQEGRVTVNQADVQTLDYDALAAIADRDPVEAARLITATSRSRGNLSPALAKLRKDCLRRARHDDGRKVNWLAARVGLAMSGISRLTRAPRSEAPA